MSARPVIAFVTGGYSGEAEISYKSAVTIERNIDRDKYEVYKIDIRKTFGRGRPDVRRRLFIKYLSVQCKRAFILVVKFIPLRFSAFCRMVMQRLAENVFAQVVPVRFRVSHVQVPGLVHRIGRGYLLCRNSAEKDEPFVSIRYALGKK